MKKSFEERPMDRVEVLCETCHKIKVSRTKKTLETYPPKCYFCKRPRPLSTSQDSKK